MAEYDRFLDLPEGPVEAPGSLEEMLSTYGDVVYDADDHEPIEAPEGPQEAPETRTEQEQAGPAKKQDTEARRRELLAQLRQKLTEQTTEEQEIMQEITAGLSGDDSDAVFDDWMEQARKGRKIPRQAQAALFDYFRARTAELYLGGELGYGESCAAYIKHLLAYMPAAEREGYVRMPQATFAADPYSLTYGLIAYVGALYVQDSTTRAAAEARLKARGRMYWKIDYKRGGEVLAQAMKATKEAVEAYEKDTDIQAG